MIEQNNPTNNRGCVIVNDMIIIDMEIMLDKSRPNIEPLDFK